tara:strand:+ start:453 stop:1037 length:585 start_codon:yes stop_codon:yes gene_type:complete
MKLTKKTKYYYGVGINDAGYPVHPRINGKRVICPFYSVWIAMLNRCYCKKYHKIRPTYIGCTVAKEWFIFSKFKNWMVKQDWKGKALDKDMLIQNNRVYGPSTCIFVTSQINSLTTKPSLTIRKHPTGVSYCKSFNKYKAQCSVKGKDKYLGCYNTPEEAHEAYKKFKYKYIAEIASQQIEPLRTALLNYVIEP